MFLFRGVIGFLFNKKIFRIASLGGQVVDDIINACQESKALKGVNFDRVGWPVSPVTETRIALFDQNRRNSFELMPDQVIFKVSTQSDSASIDINTMVQQFNELWKVCDKTLKFPAVRRIGLVGEYRIKEESKGRAGSALVSSLTKFDPSKNIDRFHLTYSERDMPEGATFNMKTSDYANTIYTFYMSEMDETPKEGFIHANIDYQRYFNPAKINPLAELASVKNDYLKKKNAFKAKAVALGLPQSE